MKIKNHIDLTKVNEKIHSDEFWLFSAKEWQRILYDYIPNDTNQLRRNVEYRAKEIEYKSPYSRYIYQGMKMIDPLLKVGGLTNDGINWFSRPGIKKVNSREHLNMKNGTRLWDKKAIQDKKNLLLLRSMQNWINKNI